MRSVQQVIDTLGVVQIDSVNVLSRAHYLPFFSRLGPYDRALVDRATTQKPLRLVEYWAHEASLIPPSTRPYFQWRMDGVDGVWPSIAKFARENSGYVETVLDAVEQSGPMTATETERFLETTTERERDNWGWNWSQTKYALEYLFYAGRITSAGRTAQFERRFDSPSRALPQAGSALSRQDSTRALIEIAARAHGVGTLKCLRDYFRLKTADALPAIESLVEDGVLQRVEVRGWGRPAFLHSDARFPRRVDAAALLVPFDPLIFERARLEALFGMRYRIEIYTPKYKRVHGYYVLPFLLGEEIVARVDLKADRQAGALRVQASHIEPEIEAGRAPDIARALGAELWQMAAWLDLSDVVVEPVGELAGELARAVAATSSQP